MQKEYFLKNEARHGEGTEEEISQSLKDYYVYMMITN